MFTDNRSKDGEQTECDDYESSDENSTEFMPSTPVCKPHPLKEQWRESDELNPEEQYGDEHEQEPYYDEQEQEPYYDEQEQRHVSFEWCQPYRESG